MQGHVHWQGVPQSPPRPQDLNIPPPGTRPLGDALLTPRAHDVEQSEGNLSETDDFNEGDWTSKNYLGPPFPSMSREMNFESGPDRTNYREEQRQLKLMINEELQNVHRLENLISRTIYGSATEAPCSMLDHQDVVYAVSNLTSSQKILENNSQ